MARAHSSRKFRVEESDDDSSTSYYSSPLEDSQGTAELLRQPNAEAFPSTCRNLFQDCVDELVVLSDSEDDTSLPSTPPQENTHTKKIHSRKKSHLKSRDKPKVIDILSSEDESDRTDSVFYRRMIFEQQVTDFRKTSVIRTPISKLKGYSDNASSDDTSSEHPCNISCRWSTDCEGASDESKQENDFLSDFNKLSLIMPTGANDQFAHRNRRPLGDIEMQEQNVMPYLLPDVQMPCPIPNITPAAKPPKKTRATAESDAQKSMGRTPATVREAAQFAKNREECSKYWFDEFNTHVFSGLLPEVPIIWNPRLMKTAGQCVYRESKGIKTMHIELSSKAIDSEYRLQRTLLHECCHAAQFWVDAEFKPPHGPAFKRWGAKATDKYPLLKVDTCHSYEIYAPHRYSCSQCHRYFQRHSKSQTEGRFCRWCNGTIVYDGKFAPDGTKLKTRTPHAPSEYNIYMKDRLAELKKQIPNAKTSQLMSVIAKEWQQEKKKRQEACPEVDLVAFKDLVTC
eukprot:Filipodium_phascolosomae@DN1284_c0_g1_i1.p1